MNTRDVLLRGSFKNCNVRFVLVETTDTITKAIKTHDTDPVASLLLAEALTVASLLSSQLTDTEKYALRWQYNGKIGSILADVTAENHVRGIPKENLLMDADDEQALYGDGGTVTLIKSDRGRVISSGTSETRMSNITNDVAFYLSTSDQIETEMVTKCRFNPDPNQPVKISAGLLLQALPDCDLVEFEKMRDSLKEEACRDILISGQSPEVKLQTLLKFLLSQTDQPEVTDIREVVQYEFGASPDYKCSCSRARMIESLQTINLSEIQDLLDSEAGLKLKCDYCKTEYIFHKEIK
ncbi:MAG: Hsp33 family molecular chaperone HslO [Lentisphaeria bacterium]|nr:Hsp33 family molecular chaperone HslO [Lentisphaeria bacterium]